MENSLANPSREEASNTLKEKFNINEFVFTSNFHIPTNIELKEGTKPFGYFQNIKVNGKPIFYPKPFNGLDYNTKVTVKASLRNDLINGEEYIIKLELADEKYRSRNPYLLHMKSYSKNTTDSIPENDITSIIKEIYGEKLNQNSPYTMVELANSVESLATDIYSENKRFIYELIQNADDSAMTDNAGIEIQILPNYVIISHNGKPFDARDIRGLCGIGIGTKKNDSTKTGYKGIGFKSVFGQPEGLVYVKTADTLFRFDKVYLKNKGWNSKWDAKWGNKEHWETKEGIEFSCPWQMIPINSESTNDVKADTVLNSAGYTVKTAIKINNEHKLLKDIKELFADARFLLFLRKIKKVSLVATNFTLQLEKKTDTTTNYVALLKNETILSNWYIKSWLHLVPDDIRLALAKDAKTPKKLQDIEKTELSFAFQLNKECNAIHLLTPDQSPIYTYLPTSVTEYGLPFLINSNFLVDAGREKLHKDRIWNQWLFKVIGYEVVVCCAEFAKSVVFKTSYLDILNSDYYNESDELRKSFNEGLKEGLRSKPFIPNIKDELILISKAVIDDVKIIDASIVDAQTVSSFLNTLENYANISPENIIASNNQLKKLENYGIKKIKENDLKLLFKSTVFLNQLSLNNNYNLLKYLIPLDKKDFTGSWNYLIRNNNFIITSDGDLDKIPLVCFPINTYVTEFGEETKLINYELYESFSDDETVIEWLKTFGVKEPSATAYLEKEIIAKIDEVINDENYLQTTEFILELHLKGNLEKEHYDKLQDLALKTKHGFSKAKNCYLPKEFHPEIDFSNYLSITDTVVQEYIGKYNSFEWKSFLLKLNVSEDISFINNYQAKFTELDPLYKAEALLFAKQGHSYPGLITEQNVLYINYFTFLASTVQYDFSTIFWNRFISKYFIAFEKESTINQSHGNSKNLKLYKINNEPLTSLDAMSWGYYSTNRVLIPSFFFWFLNNKSCIPTNQKKCLRASDTFINSKKITALAGNYLPIINIEKEVSKDWYQLLGLKTVLKLSDLLSILTAINNDTYRGLIKTENKKRISDIYTELISLLDKSSTEEEEIIKEWAYKNKIVCIDFIPRKASDVIWLSVDGFTDEVNNLPLLFLPKNFVGTQNEEKFLKLLQVQIIDHCEHRATDQKELLDLKIKALEILPAIGILLKNSYKISNMEEYLFDTFAKLDAFSFYHCKKLELVLNYNNTEINGSKISSYKTEHELFITNIWNNSIERFNLTKYFITLFKGTYIAQEIQLFLGITIHEISHYLQSQNLDFQEVKNLPIYKKIQEKIQEIKLNQLISHEINRDEIIIYPDTEHITVLDEVAEGSLENSYAELKAEIEPDENKVAFTPVEVRELEALLKRSMSSDEMSDIWIIAAFRALKHYESEGFDMSYANSDFDNVIAKRYLENVVAPDRKTINILVRSAKYKLLRLTFNAWTDLAQPNFELFVLTGNNATDFTIYNDQYEIAAINDDSWVMRLDGVNKVINIDSLFTGNTLDIKYESMELLIRLPGNTNYNSVFSKFSNKVNLDDF